MPHYVLNFKHEFNLNVMKRFVVSYEKGETPNPCIDCNKYIKFSGLLLRARQLECECMATGHYARIEKQGARWVLKRGVDAEKDQSYFLYMMTQEQLARAKFPLGALTKKRVREIALEADFINAKKADSQDICFVPDGKYGEFIAKYNNKALVEGDILDINGNVIGRHRGHENYTIGQRRGLGVSSNSGALYVCKKDAMNNTVTLAGENELYKKSCIINQLNLIAVDSLYNPLRLSVKKNYLHKGAPAIVTQLDDDRALIEFENEERAITPGQAAVFYDGDAVLGGGTIV
jgi:tRNA-specific 2-thiouridylase